MSKRIFYLALLIAICFVPSDAQQQVSDQEIIRQARQVSYSVKNQGLTELKCTVQPDWDAMYAAVVPDKVGAEQLLPILKGTHFTVLLGPDGASTVSRESDIAPSNEEVAERVRQSIGGMEQVITGFFQSWSSLVFNSLLPEPDGDYHLQRTGDQYALSFGDEANQVAVVLNHDLSIQEIKATSRKIDATLRPQWSASSNGFLLTGYAASFKADAGEPVELSVKIANQDVEGLSLPSTVDANIPFGTGTLPLRLVFLNYRVKKR